MLKRTRRYLKRRIGLGASDRPTLADVMRRGDPLWLNVGSASVNMPGYLSVDVRAESGADIVSDMVELPKKLDGRVDRIYCRHALEHLSRSNARAALKNWRTTLRSGGELTVIVPDLGFHVDQFRGDVTSSFPDQMEHAMAGFFGWSDPNRGGQDWDIHRWGYTYETLSAILTEFGYTKIARNLEGPDTEPWHLNVSCKAG